MSITNKNKLAFACSLNLICAAAFAQVDSLQHKLMDCKKNWVYVTLAKETEGKVLFFEPPVVEGNLSGLSNTIIVTDSGDTIRVLQLCQQPSEFTYKLQLNDDVTVTPDTYVDATISETPADPLSCVLKETFLGKIKKRSN